MMMQALKTNAAIKSLVMDAKAIERSLARMTHEIIERNSGAEDLILLGIKRRGIPLAHALAANIAQFEGVEVPVGSIDITAHRDDITDADREALAGDCWFPCSIKDKRVVIVDDVLYTGRSVRAALEAVFAYGRPREVQLAVLVDRGHREIPIRADYVGKNIPTAVDELIVVHEENIDGENAVYICEVAHD